jgi:hypothetical protein
MTTFSRTAIPAPRSDLLPRTTFLAAAIALAGIAVGPAAIATADPEWDVGAYDSCMAQPIDSSGSPPSAGDRNNQTAHCCDLSGGIAVYHDDATLTCAAPAANADPNVLKPIGRPPTQPTPGPGGRSIGIPPSGAPAA